MARARSCCLSSQLLLPAHAFCLSWEVLSGPPWSDGRAYLYSFLACYGSLRGFQFFWFATGQLLTSKIGDSNPARCNHADKTPGFVVVLIRFPLVQLLLCCEKQDSVMLGGGREALRSMVLFVLFVQRIAPIVPTIQASCHEHACVDPPS